MNLSFVSYCLECKSAHGVPRRQHCNLAFESLLNLIVGNNALLVNDDLVHVLVEPFVGEHGVASVAVVISGAPGILDAPLRGVSRRVGLVSCRRGMERRVRIKRR